MAVTFIDSDRFETAMWELLIGFMEGENWVSQTLLDHWGVQSLLGGPRGSPGGPRASSASLASVASFTRF